MASGLGLAVPMQGVVPVLAAGALRQPQGLCGDRGVLVRGSGGAGVQLIPGTCQPRCNEIQTVP